MIVIFAIFTAYAYSAQNTISVLRVYLDQESTNKRMIELIDCCKYDKATFDTAGGQLTLHGVRILGGGEENDSRDIRLPTYQFGQFESEDMVELVNKLKVELGMSDIIIYAIHISSELIDSQVTCTP